jgi:hypothetical protein
MARTNPDNPDLSMRVTGFKPIAGSNFTGINLKVSRFKIDRHNFAMIACLYLRSHLRLIDLIPTTGKLFLAISGLSNCDPSDLGAT